MTTSAGADAHPEANDPRAGVPAPRGGGWQRLAFFVGVALVLVSQLAPLALGAIGHWLIVEDDLAAVDVIFVHAGHLPFRSIEAAEIYGDGFASEVWLAPISPTPESLALLDLGIDRPPGHYWRSLVLSRMGVPRNAIRVLSAEVLNTRDEVQSVADELTRRGLSSAILVTSKQHSRRVRMLWHRVAPEGLTAIVRPSASDPFDPDAWWTNTEDGQATLHELAGITAVWLGVGLRPERE